MSATATDTYPVGPEGQELPGEYDLRVEMEDAELCLSLHRLRTGQPVDGEETPAETVCRRYVTVNLGEPTLGHRKRNCAPEGWVDTWIEVTADTVEAVVATLMVQEPELAPHREWMATAVAEMVQEVTR